ncbi:Peptidoglycan/LPS O-acetylase OafA/YrhL, contains acyltransferase and SGNH-hydrolase domains [Mucilaginibacter sp. OK268]|uniref:acyltransferase family protein n=1 Tax=Mucilaginibacter sp. OK268 TaxID=1881048 RepID=UPI000886F43D|nr:acyltransferase [Mucilaginibacter sp. OK268]SDP60130.1 Peptidoglycan/LPS O-acetylase OafA/YrhL, contains acyltransferase and SGNH-hydrolase domains [Mucilaginibacter sp. OK268]
MPGKRYYKPELDLLRFCAFLFVFFTHRMDLAPIDPVKYYWPYHISLVGVFGVPLFFFLSAFLITELLTQEQELYGRVSVKSFYIRRILRIWPLYFIFFFGMVLVTHLSDQFGTISPKTQLAFSLFSGNWYITFNNWLPSYPINPLWSISVEEQLYILIPLIIYFGGKRGLKIFSFIAILVAYLTIIYYARQPTNGFSGEWTNSFVQFQFFAAGILLAIYLKNWQPNWTITVRLIAFIGGVVSWLIASIVCKVHADAPHLSTIPEAITGWILILSGVILLFLSLYGTSVKYLPTPLVYLGRISYGLYVFHITIFYLVYHIFEGKLDAFSKLIGMQEWKNEIGFLIAFIITVMIATLSYNFFEKPFLKLKRRFTIILSRD